jgi:hypothetical protein
MTRLQKSAANHEIGLHLFSVFETAITRTQQLNTLASETFASLPILTRSGFNLIAETKRSDLSLRPPSQMCVSSKPYTKLVIYII